MRIAIFTEGGAAFGIGHVVRCHALYEELKQRGHKPFFVVHGDEGVSRYLGEVRHVRKDWIEAARQDRLGGDAAGVPYAIIDSYLADKEIYHAIARRIPRCVFYDDENRLPYPSGLVVNGGVFAPDLDYPTGGGREYLLGSPYALLRPEFRHVTPAPPREVVQRILVTVGGSDLRGLVPGILGRIRLAAPKATVQVVLGAAFTNRDAIRSAADAAVEILESPSAAQMREAMLAADIAVCAGGQTLHELAVTGVAPVVVGVAENQRPNIEAWRRIGFITFAGWWTEPSLLDDLQVAVTRLLPRAARAERSQIGHKRIDGRGAERVIDAMLGASPVEPG